MALENFNSDEFEKHLKVRAFEIENHLKKLLPSKENTIEEKITSSMRYALLNGGKRIRAYLSMESCKLYDIDAQ